MATEVAADALGEEQKGCVVGISGGNDKQGFLMKQGVLSHDLPCFLLSKTSRKTAEKEVPVCLRMPCSCQFECYQSTWLLGRGEGENSSGLTETTVSQQLEPTRASRIESFSNLLSRCLPICCQKALKQKR